jgi:chromosome segregation ATPase
LARLVDDNESNVRRFQNDVNQVVSNRLNDAEDRFNTRLMAAESRMKEDAGAKIAEIQAHVGRVNANIDDTMAVLNNRLESVDDRFLQSDRRFDELEESVKGIDQNALDELTNKMSAAVGEAMLVRIEVERFQKEVNERTDTLSVRMTDVETQLQDAVMDVSTAIQLDRLEEIERSLAEIDPTKFVLKDPSADDDDDALDEMPSGESEAPLIDFAHFGEPQEPLRNSSHAAEEASRAFPAPAPPPPSV